MYKIHELPDDLTKRCNQQQLNDNNTYEYSQIDLNLFRLQFLEHTVYMIQTYLTSTFKKMLTYI